MKRSDWDRIADEQETGFSFSMAKRDGGAVLLRSERLPKRRFLTVDEWKSARINAFMRRCPVFCYTHNEKLFELRSSRLTV